MTKKDYKLIAECISKGIKYGQDKVHTINEIIPNLTVELKRDNANFNREKFIKACIIE